MLERIHFRQGPILYRQNDDPMQSLTAHSTPAGMRVKLTAKKKLLYKHCEMKKRIIKRESSTSRGFARTAVAG
jgi:hypothetical protein